MLDFGLDPVWEMAVNILFLAMTGGVAVNAIRHRRLDGGQDFVRLLFGCIAAVFFFLVLFQDVLGLVSFS